MAHFASVTLPDRSEVREREKRGGEGQEVRGGVRRGEKREEMEVRNNQSVSSNDLFLIRWGNTRQQKVKKKKSYRRVTCCDCQH